VTASILLSSSRSRERDPFVDHSKLSGGLRLIGYRAPLGFTADGEGGQEVVAHFAHPAKHVSRVTRALQRQ
jgi:hypothetical protein